MNVILIIFNLRISNFHECIPHDAGQVRKIPAVDPNADGTVSEIIEGQGNGAEIQQPTPVSSIS
jgi:hypothetical protein